MSYAKPSFSVPVTDAESTVKRGAMCAEKGHSASDSRGRCLCCGEKIPGRATANEQVELHRALHPYEKAAAAVAATIYPPEPEPEL